MQPRLIDFRQRKEIRFKRREFADREKKICIDAVGPNGRA